MERRTVDEVISLLRRSPVLAACRDEARSRRDLTDLTDFSRTTVYRSTVALTKRGLLEKTPAGYQTTPLGVALLAAGDSFVSGVDALDRLEPLFERVSHPDLLEHAHLLTDARVVVADASNPYRVVERAMERFEATTRSRGTLASTTAAEAMDRAVPSMDDKESFERIFAASAVEAHETVGGDAFDAVAASDALSVLVADDAAVPFSFAIDDDGVTVVGHDPATGLPTVHVESDRPAARAWLDGVYEECRAAANPL